MNFYSVICLKVIKEKQCKRTRELPIYLGCVLYLKSMKEHENTVTDGSFLFSKQLSVRNSRNGEKKEFDLKELGQKIHQERKRPKRDHKLVDLEQLRKKSTKVRDSKLTNIADSTKKPDGFELGEEGSLSMNLQCVLEKSRHDTKYGIVGRDGINDSCVGTVESIQEISDSLRVVTIDTNKGKSIVWLVCLWNEWVDLKVKDLILVEELIEITGVKMCKKWKKIL